MRRATWVRSRPEAAELVSWCLQNEFDALFLGVSSDIDADELAWLRAVVTQAHEAKISVAALGGDVAWLDRPRKAKAWARGIVSTGLFDAVHVDLEPWNSDDWVTRRDAMVADYLTVLRTLSKACPMPLEADLAFWLHEVPARPKTSLDVAVMGIVDAVTILSFRNTASGPDGVLSVASRALAAANRAGIPCRLAVETRDLGQDPQSTKQTFFGLGLETLETVLSTVDILEATNAAYNGVAIKTSLAGEALKTRWRAGR